MRPEIMLAHLELKDVGDNGIFEGWASVFDIEDDYGDTVKPGAFKESLLKRMPKIYLLHETPVGVLTVAEEKSKGLWVEGQPDESSDGLDARAKLKSKALDALSIGYRTKTFDETGHFKRDLLEVDLYHVGLVPFGANDEATITSVKALDLEGITTIRELERALRDVGLSRKAARMLLSPGYLAKLTQRDSDDGMAETAEHLHRLARIITPKGVQGDGPGNP